MEEKKVWQLYQLENISISLLRDKSVLELGGEQDDEGEVLLVACVTFTGYAKSWQPVPQTLPSAGVNTYLACKAGLCQLALPVFSLLMPFLTQFQNAKAVPISWQ